MEVELKLLIAPSDAAAFRRLVLLRQFTTEKPHSDKLCSTYFDTSELHPIGHGMELRVRHAGAVWIETLKAGGDHFNRLVEREVTRLGGIESLYSHSCFTREEFATAYGMGNYEVLKARYDPQHRLPGLYEKCVLNA